jgi:PIN domain nuclease of toxin-antitoxin system
MIAPLLDTHIWIWYVADTLEKCEMRNADFGLRNWGLRIAKRV